MPTSYSGDSTPSTQFAPDVNPHTALRFSSGEVMRFSSGELMIFDGSTSYSGDSTPATSFSEDATP